MDWNIFAETIVNGDGKAIHMMLPPFIREVAQDGGATPLAWHEIPARGTE